MFTINCSKCYKWKFRHNNPSRTQPNSLSVIFSLVESSNGDDSKHLKYKCHTTKILEMTRSFLVEKTKEQVHRSSVP